MLNFRYIGNIMQKDKVSTSDTITFPSSEIANFFREIQLTINIVRGYQDQYRIDVVLPDSLRSNDKDRPSYDDCVIFIDVLRELMRYTEENKRQLETSNKGLVDLIRTSINVDGRNVTVNTMNNEFDKQIHMFCASKQYKI